MDLTETEFFEETKCKTPCTYHVYDLLGIQSYFNPAAYTDPFYTTFSKKKLKFNFLIKVFRILLCSAKE